MSKMDELRALREAKYAGTPARVEVEPESGVEPCGHRSINGRTCSRERDHPAKSHRYS